MIKPAGQNESKLFPLCVHESIKAHVNTSQFLERDWNLDRLINLDLEFGLRTVSLGIALMLKNIRSR